MKYLVAMGCLLVGLLGPGCGSGGGGANQIAVCPLDSFTPNYATKVSHLLNWNSFPVRVFFVRDTNFTQARRVLALAGFDQWVNATGSAINYTELNSSTNADITVTFDPTTQNGLTQISFSGLSMGFAEMSIGVKNQTDLDLGCIASHEFGHALGIDGHSDLDGDLMFPIHFIGTPCPVTARDLNTIKTGYCHLFGKSVGGNAIRPTGPFQTKIIQ
ncbi:MAG: matrixin family metalloprotease [Chthonomonadales bacterium]